MKRKRRSNSEIGDETEEEDFVLEGEEDEEMTLNKKDDNATMSEYLNLFQAIHVLQSREDEDKTKSNNSLGRAELLKNEDDICIGSVIFASVIGKIFFYFLRKLRFPNLFFKIIYEKCSLSSLV